MVEKNEWKKYPHYSLRMRDARKAGSVPFIACTSLIIVHQLPWIPATSQCIWLPPPAADRVRTAAWQRPARFANRVEVSDQCVMLCATYNTHNRPRTTLCPSTTTALLYTFLYFVFISFSPWSKSLRRDVLSSYRCRHHTPVRINRPPFSYKLMYCVCLVWVVPHCEELVYKRTFPLPLPGTDRINFVVRTSCPSALPTSNKSASQIAISDIFAGRLDENRLVKSFQDALTYYPHASGRLRRKGDDWSVRRSFIFWSKYSGR